MRIRFPHACRIDCELCRGTTSMDADVLPAIFQHARQSGQGRVYVQGRHLPLDPQLEEVVRLARTCTLQVALIEDDVGSALPAAAESLRRFGVAAVYLSFPPLASKEPPPQPPAEWKERLRVLITLERGGQLVAGTHMVLTAASAVQMPALLRMQAHLSIRELLVSESRATGSPVPPLAPAAATVVEQIWLAATTKEVSLRVIGFEATRYVNPVAGEPAPTCDSALIELLRNDMALPAPRAGIRMLGRDGRGNGLKKLAKTPEALRGLALELAARKTPVIDLPHCLGGTQLAVPEPASFLKAEACGACAFDDRCAGTAPALTFASAAAWQSALRPLPTWYNFRRSPHVLVIPSQERDPVMSVSTLPALAITLQARGVDAELVSPWTSMWDPHVLPPPGSTDYQPDWTGMSGVESWLETHDLRRIDLVITSDLATARFILGLGLLAAQARVVVTDFHMLQGMNETVSGLLAPGARAAEGGWWPSPQLILESAFPGYVKLYQNYGVPLEQIAWRPFPLYPGHFPPGGDVHACATIFSGGEHLRDLDTLIAATERLPADVHVVDLYAFGEPFAGNAHLRHCGYVIPQGFYNAIAKSRFVVLPLLEDRNCAAGITVMAMALMAGRPVVASSIAAVRDYIEHGVQGLLVPPGDPDALAAAITRLDTDRALLSALAAGARAAGQQLSTDRWADEIMSGGAPLVPIHRSSGWRNW